MWFQVAIAKFAMIYLDEMSLPHDDPGFRESFQKAYRFQP